MGWELRILSSPCMTVVGLGLGCLVRVMGGEPISHHMLCAEPARRQTDDGLPPWVDPGAEGSMETPPWKDLRVKAGGGSKNPHPGDHFPAEQMHGVWDKGFQRGGVGGDRLSPRDLLHDSGGLAHDRGRPLDETQDFRPWPLGPEDGQGESKLLRRPAPRIVDRGPTSRGYRRNPWAVGLGLPTGGRARERDTRQEPAVYDS